MAKKTIVEKFRDFTSDMFNKPMTKKEIATAVKKKKRKAATKKRAAKAGPKKKGKKS